jgi:hypothetical protein
MMLISFIVLFMLFDYDFCIRLALVGLVVKIWSVVMIYMKKDERPDL